jgi:hypothetical protein
MALASRSHVLQAASLMRLRPRTALQVWYRVALLQLPWPPTCWYVETSPELQERFSFSFRWPAINCAKIEFCELAFAVVFVLLGDWHTDSHCFCFCRTNSVKWLWNVFWGGRRDTGRGAVRDWPRNRLCLRDAPEEFLLLLVRGSGSDRMKT